MGYRLRDGLSFCVVGGRTIFLDIHADRYFCCPLSLEPGLQTIIGGGSPASQDASGWLVRHRILEEDAYGPGRLVAASVDVPQTCIALEKEPQPSMLAVSTALVAQARASFWLRVMPFRSLTGRLASLKAGIREHRAADEAVWRGASAFHNASRFLSRRDRCLPRSIALAAYYWRRGHAADLVIGVRRTPFAAHCWVQDKQYVLNDEADHVRTYTPIWVL